MHKLLLALCAGLLASCSAVEIVSDGITDTKEKIEDTVDAREEDHSEHFDEDDEVLYTGPVTVLDNEYITVTLDNIVHDFSTFYNFNLTYQNKTDQKITVTLDSMSVNDLWWSGFSYVDVKKRGTYKYSLSTMVPSEETDTTIDNVRFNFTIEDKNYSTLCMDYGKVYLNGEENAVSDLYSITEEDQILVDNEFVTIVDMGDLYTENNWLYKPLYAYNKTDTTINLNATILGINGTECEMYDYDTLPPMAGSYFGIDLYKSDIEDYDLALEDVTSLNTVFKMYDTEYEDLCEEALVLE